MRNMGSHQLKKKHIHGHIMRLKYGSIVVLSLMILIGACSPSSSENVDIVSAQDRIAVLVDRSQKTDSSALVREILEDGQVDDAEYDRSVLSVVTCAEEQGVSVKVDDDGHGVKFTIQYSDKNHTVFMECNDRLYRDIGMVYSIQNSLPSDVIDRINKLVLECLNREGHTVEHWPNTTKEIDPIVEAICYDESVLTVQSR